MRSPVQVRLPRLMEKITKPRKPEEDRYIFTEGIDYFKTEKTSIWGTGDKDTLQLLKKIKIRGKWLNLASGDGRYNLNLLKKADFVVASDIDESALNKLWQNTPEKYKSKLKTGAFDITKKFPFKNNSFDGVFCAGTLHLFPKEVLRQIISEVDRVLKPNGRVIIDFATNIKRTSPSGKLITFGKEPLYTLKDAKTTLKNLFRNYQMEMHESEVVEDLEAANPPYTLNCKFVILIADKNVVAKTIKTYEETADDYCKAHFDIDMTPQQLFFVGNLRGKTILDIGCGPGRDTKFFFKNGFEVIGIDLTPKFIKIASKLVPNAKFIIMDMRKLEFPENYFDGIWVCASFLHIPKEEAKNTLFGFKRVLKPKGLMYLTVKEGTGEKLVLKNKYKKNPKFFSFYTKNKLKKIIESSGFKIMKIDIDKKKDNWIDVFATKE